MDFKGERQMANVKVTAEAVYSRMQKADLIEFGTNLGAGLAGAGITAGLGKSIKDSAMVGGAAFAGSSLLTKCGRLFWGNKKILNVPGTTINGK